MSSAPPSEKDPNSTDACGGSAPAAAASSELAWQIAHLRTALDKMDQGLAMYDASARLIVCNERYLSIYGISADLVKPGCPLRDILKYKAVHPTTNDLDQHAQRILDLVNKGERSRSVLALADGRKIAVVTNPIGDGSWVATHEDITELWHAEDELRRTKNFLDTVIDNVPSTILVKSASDFRYVLVNKAAEQYLNMPRQQVVGHTADELFGPAAGAAVTEHDLHAIKHGGKHDYESRPLHLPDDDSRCVLGKKIAVNGPAGEPEYLISIIEDITERVKTAQELSYQAHHDSLTGLPNRVFFMQRVDDALMCLTTMGLQFTVLLIDLDRFKSINDSLGHPVGDALLVSVALKLQSALDPTDVVARLGGDEFAILQVVEGDQREAGISLASRVLDVFAGTYVIDDNQVVTGASIGIAIAPDHGANVEGLMKSADLALYHAKARGKNQYCIFEPGMEAEANTRHALETSMRNALQTSEFELHYQPVFDIATEKPCGAEALVRWRRPDRGLVSPAEFIPLAEETGLIVPLGEWVLRTACSEAMKWPAGTKIAVNVSPVQFRKGDLVDAVARALTESGLPPEQLELEITESVLLDNSEGNLAILAALKGLGVSIVLDDFGTGYSSLSYLKAFPFDKIKIDRSFVSDLSNRSDCAAIVCAVINLARILNMATTAEGVETREQLMLLRAAGCSFAQGYLLGRPVPAAEAPFATAATEAA